MLGGKPFFLLVALLSVALLPFFAGHPARAEEVVENLRSRLLDQQKKVHQLNKSIENQKDMLFKSQQREIKLLTKLERLEQQLLAERKRLSALKEKLHLQEKRLARRQGELDKLLDEQEELTGRVKERLAAYYQMGDVGVLNALFSISSLSDLLEMNEYLDRLLEHDHRTLADFRSKIAEVRKAREQVALEKKRLAVLYEDVLEQEKKTTATQEKHLALLRQVRTEKKLHQLAVREMEKAASQITATLEKLTEEFPAPQTTHNNSGFAACKGQLPPPVAGTVVTGFDEEIRNKFGITARTHGIDIKTQPGAAIKAIYPGRVVYSGYLRGYGNLLIVDHGLQYYSIMSRFARFLKEKDEKVKAGEMVGIMGNSNGASPADLHFEIRHGSEPEDPLSWLDLKRLPVAIDEPEKIKPTALSSRGN
ncbi:MAG: peptidoglycan DD-metalloendopeptidase family protein [Deltaproteobacteria bacterium]